MPRPTNTWKKREQKAAALFGSRRAPLSGSNGAITSSDTLHPELFIEAKHRKSNCAVWTLFTSVRELAAKESKLPLLALSLPQKRGCLIVVHSDDLEKLAEIMLKEKNGNT